MKCVNCGAEINPNSSFCTNCGTKVANMPTQVAPAQAVPQAPAAPSQQQYTPMQATPQQAVPQPYVINNTTTVEVTKKNGIGTGGFVCALIGLFLSWVPILGWILWLVGAVLSVVGLFRQPRGLAIAGTVISFIDILILIAVAGMIAGTGAGLFAALG